MLWSLTAIAIVTGLACRWIFRCFTNRERVTQAKRQMQAQIYALRLFSSDPAVMWRAQKQLLKWNARYFKLMLPAAAITIVPGIVLYVQLDKGYGSRPLAEGESAVVTATFPPGVSLDDAAIDGRDIVVETPVVRVPERHAVFWRVRGIGRLDLWLSGAHARRFEVAYPAACMRVFQYELPWQVWFLAVSILAALAIPSVTSASLCSILY